MFSGGNTTVHVSNLDAAVRFYTETLGLSLTNRIGAHWATVWAGPSYWTTEAALAGLTIGLRPAAPEDPAPGTPGSVVFGLETYTPLEQLVEVLVGRGARIEGETVRFEAGNSVAAADTDGNGFYLHEFPPEMQEEEDRTRMKALPPPAIDGGHAVVFVSSLDAAVRFYTRVLGLTLTNRYDPHWATVEAGRFVIGLHPHSPKYPAPGTNGGITLALHAGDPMSRVVARLADCGVRAKGQRHVEARDAVVIQDPDGNRIELIPADTTPGSERALVTTAAPDGVRS